VRLVLHDPYLLLFSVRNRAATSGFNGGQGCGRLPTEMDEGAGSGDGGTANAPPAMNADSLAAAETAGEVAHKCPKGARIGRELVIGNGVVEKLNAKLFGKERLFCQLEHVYLVFTEQRDERVDAGALEMDEFPAQAAAAAGTEDDCQRHGGQRCGR
jgi:hypothetical protein